MLLFSCNSQFSSVEQGFITPPDSIRTSVYWYWINDHISKEGVVKDLQSMKQAGINRVFIGSNIVSGDYFGKVKVFSDEWWEVLHTAMKTASELDIEIGMFNCPGWSQSGGPWVKPEQAMRYLASSELRVKGPAKISQLLVAPDTFFQDVKVLAFPVAADYGQNLLDAPGVKLVPHNLKMLPSQSPSPSNRAKYVLSEDESALDVILPEAKTVRSLSIYPAGNLNVTGEIRRKDGTGYQSIKRFDARRTNYSVQVGFDPYSPIVVSLGETEAREFRILFDRHGNGDSEIHKITLTSTPVLERFAEKTLAKMTEGNLPPWDYYLWDAQPELKNVRVTQAEQVVDISDRMSPEGLLEWDAPEGNWIIMRTGMRLTGVENSPASPEGTGLEVDKMSKAHVAAHFDGFIGKVLERIPAEDRTSFKVVVADSYEMGSQNFTDGFSDEFKQRYGYDATPFLPVFQGHIIGSADLSDRFLWDVRRLVADKVSYDYVGGLREISHRHGLTTWLENYGHWGFPGEFLQYGGQSDEVGGEFWDGSGTDRYENRVAASCAHIYGKNKVSAESFTSGGPAFTRYPKHFKGLGDWSFTEGVNSTLLHVYIEQPYENDYPGIDGWFGNEFNRKNTWFSQMDLFTLYLKRCNFMLQQGLNIADVAYFIGEDAPKMTGIRHPELPKGFNYDYINAEVILRDMSVKDGRLVLPHGTSYRVLVLPPLETMRPELLRKIEQLVADGAVVLGSPPSRSPSLKDYPAADRQVDELARKLWGDLPAQKRSYGKGLVLNDMTLEEVFALLNVVPDCLSDGHVLFTHRTLDGKEIYFISNQREESIRIRTQFRVKGLQPELWDALTGEIRPLPAFEQTGETTAIPLQLEPAGSALIVFREKGRPSAKDVAANFPQPAVIATVNTPWEVTFEHDAVRRGPSETVTFPKLQDWTLSDDPRIRYYSGTAIYTTKVNVGELPQGKTFYLNLGALSAMAKVKVNGVYAGGAWTEPYRVNVTGQIRPGENTLEIEVVNTWRNRLIGDRQLPEQERIFQSCYIKLTAESPLQSSGLIGPVEVVAVGK
ncbi:MAG: glycoside hydrolase family 2 [Tannerella sp.]|nr:glycoside hydrolase family 2 [Tannerella sp.]